MALHPEKTKFILFSNSKLVNENDFNTLLNNNNPSEKFPNRISIIEHISNASTVPAMKFLGVILTKTSILSFILCNYLLNSPAHCK